MTAAELQTQLFGQIKNKLAAHLSLADEVAAVLQLSTDSAYRRIRGEKQLTFEELCTLCQRYQLSLDGLLNTGADTFVFQGSFVNGSTFRFDEYLTNLGQQVAYMCRFVHKKMFYLCKDIPIFHHFHFREIAAFKYYFWMKTILKHPDFAHKKFSFDDYPDELFALGKKALGYYNQLDSVEIWNIESINSTIRQIEFHFDTHAFAHEEDVTTLYTTLDQLMKHLEKQADAGYKFDPADAEQKQLGAFQMYFNEVILGDNSILAVLDQTKVAYLVHSVINFMITRDVQFCDHTYENIQNLMKKSTLISTVSERERARFFKVLRNRIEGRRKNMQA